MEVWSGYTCKSIKPAATDTTATSRSARYALVPALRGDGATAAAAVAVLASSVVGALVVASSEASPAPSTPSVAASSPSPLALVDAATSSTVSVAFVAVSAAESAWGVAVSTATAGAGPTNPFRQNAFTEEYVDARALSTITGGLRGQHAMGGASMVSDGGGEGQATTLAHRWWGVLNVRSVGIEPMRWLVIMYDALAAMPPTE